jgi:6-pyruvoyltetrahydropterin/6-carboxytetrahydropterin synthase
MKQTITLSRVYWFTAAHRLNSELLDSSQNSNVYDKCNNYNGHGHDYRLEVSIKGQPDKKTGMILPLGDFDSRVKRTLSMLDFKHLDREVEYFKYNLSSGELIIQFLWEQMEKDFPNNVLFHLKLWETNNNYFELGMN